MGSDSFMEEMEKAPYRLGRMRKALRELVDAVDEHAENYKGYGWQIGEASSISNEKRGYEALKAARKILEE